jgi:formiminotetrahydrofolate cyclodeaminase
MYLEGPLKKYLDDLASKKSAPGGGSAAALGASIGASLISMVANFTVNNPKYADVSERAAVILSKAEGFRKELTSLIDKDVDAYNALSKALKDTGNDSSMMEAAYKEALRPPFDICMITSECLELCEELADCGNKNLVTDTAIAAIFLEGAFFSAKFNVYINLKHIKDMDFIGEVHKRLAPLEEKMPKLKEDILEKCEDVISK